jgi:hypothetical protein
LKGLADPNHPRTESTENLFSPRERETHSKVSIGRGGHDRLIVTRMQDFRIRDSDSIGGLLWTGDRLGRARKGAVIRSEISFGNESRVLPSL